MEQESDIAKQGEKLGKKEMTDGLRDCITISHFLKHYNYEKIFKSKLITYQDQDRYRYRYEEL